MKGGTLMALAIAGVVAYFFLKRTTSASADSSPFIPYASGKPFDILSTDPNITPGTVGGYKPPVFAVPMIPREGWPQDVNVGVV